MAITNQAEADAYIKASNENKILSEQYYNAFKQTVKNSNAQYDIIQSQLAPLKDDSTIEGLQKKIELRKNLAEILSASIADSKTYFMQTNDLSSAGYGQTDNRPVYLKNMAENLKLQQAAIDSNDKKIANLETTLNQTTSKQSATEEEIAKAKAAEEATKPPPPENVAVPAKESPGVADGEKGEVKAVSTPNQLSDSSSTAGVSIAPFKVDVTGFPKIESDEAPGARAFNPLSLYSSYTYNLTLSLVTPTIYNRFINGDINAVDEAPVIVRSGGTSQKFFDLYTSQERAKGFELDLYIDDLELETVTNSKETLSATNTMKFKFKVYEPYGFSFPHKLSNLRNATSGGPDSIRGNYFLTVRFYGYKDPNEADLGEPNESQKIAHERTFCIYITTVAYKLEQGLVVYDITAVPAGQLAAFGNYGVITSNKSFQGKTVGELLLGSNPDKSVTSVVDVLNTEEKRRLDNKEIEVANIYNIEIWDAEIKDAVMINKKDRSNKRAPMPTVATPNQVNARTEYQMNYAEDGAVKYDVRTVTNSAGEPIINIIDTIISQSDYIRSKLTSVTSEDPVDPITNQPIPNDSTDTIRWYNITPKIKFLATGSGPEGKDIKRNNFAYEITYIIQIYKVPFLRTIYSNAVEKYYGPYKRYQYWYTGQNTEVLSFDVSYNFTYQIEAANSSSANVQSANAGDVPIATVGATNARNSGKDEGTNEEVNSIRSWLYGPGELVKYNLSILGDPDYIMPAFNGTIVNQLHRWYGNDYAINPGVGQIFIEIDFKQAEDYDEKTGLLKTDDRILFMDYPKSMNPKPKGFVFVVNTVSSYFSKGKFTQRITGSLPNFSAATEKNLNSTSNYSDAGEGRQSKSAGYNSYGTNDGVATPDSAQPVNDAMPGVLGTNRVAQFGVDNQISSPPIVNQTVQTSANDDNNNTTSTSNNISPFGYYSNNTNSQANQGGREETQAQTPMNAGALSNTPYGMASGTRNVIPNNV